MRYYYTLERTLKSAKQLVNKGHTTPKRYNKVMQALEEWIYYGNLDSPEHQEASNLYSQMIHIYLKEKGLVK